MIATRAKQRAFLRAFAMCGNVLGACGCAGVGRRTHYDWLDSDANYARQFENAAGIYADKLEAEADRRATQGVEEPVYYKGEECGRVRKYSDNLLMFRLKALRPEKYREHFTGELQISGFEDLEEKLRAARKRIAAAAALLVDNLDRD